MSEKDKQREPVEKVPKDWLATEKEIKASQEKHQDLFGREKKRLEDKSK